MKEKKVKRLINHLKEGGGLGRMHNSSIELIIDALEKRIPQAPINKSDYTSDDCEYIALHCPKCHYFDCCDLEDVFGKKYSFCPNCGQALRWGKNGRRKKGA